ncbi:MAG: hypothetical protein LBG90_09710 [Spirochaetaceae bacterium]|jgi:hypothetical protein|nr:hypothetical protein [Spirochaetaceae bacterium]
MLKKTTIKMKISALYRFAALCLVSLICMICPLTPESSESQPQPIGQILPITPPATEYPVITNMKPALSYLDDDDKLTTADTGRIAITLTGDSGLPYTIEVKPYTANTAMTFAETSALQPGFSGTGWRLPTHDELNAIYYLYLKQNMLRLDQFSPLFHAIRGCPSVF